MFSLHFDPVLSPCVCNQTKGDGKEGRGNKRGGAIKGQGTGGKQVGSRTPFANQSRGHTCPVSQTMLIRGAIRGVAGGRNFTPGSWEEFRVRGSFDSDVTGGGCRFTYSVCACV